MKLMKLILIASLFVLMNCGGEDKIEKSDSDTFLEAKNTLEDEVFLDGLKEASEISLETTDITDIQETETESCAPNCENKECGNDDCGGSCGECEEKATCVEGMCCEPSVIGSYNISIGYARDIFIINNLALVADSLIGAMVTLDISNPKSPALKSIYQTTGGYAWAIAASTSGLVYLAAGNEGLLIIDINNPAEPSLKAVFNTIGGDAYEVFVLRDRVYLIDFVSGLYIIDAAVPSNPSLLGKWDSINLNDVFVNGSTAYLVGSQPIDMPKTGM